MKSAEWRRICDAKDEMGLISQGRQCIKVHSKRERMNYCSILESQILPRCIPKEVNSLCFPPDSKKRTDFEVDLAWFYLWEAKINVSAIPDRSECDRFFTSRGISAASSDDYDKFYPIDTSKDDAAVSGKLDQMRQKRIPNTADHEVPLSTAPPPWSKLLGNVVRRGN